MPISRRLTRQQRRSRRRERERRSWLVFVRDTLMAEDPHCRYCRCRLNERDNDDRQATIDHIIPSSLGGSDLWDNLQLLCRQCNGEKGATVGRSRNVIAQAHSLRGPAGSGYHRLADGLSAREEIEEQLEEAMSRCDFCSGFGCIGECHDLPPPGRRVSSLPRMSRVVSGDGRCLNDPDQPDSLTAEDRPNQRSSEEKA